MKTGTKIGLIAGGVLLLFGLLVIGVVVAFTFYSVSSGTSRARELYKKRTAETVGTVKEARIGTGRNVIYTYQYSVNGVSYTGEDFSTRAYGDNRYLTRVGKEGKVCYEPSDPGSSEFYLYEFMSDERRNQKPFCANTTP